jgi:hypothetical protein
VTLVAVHPPAADAAGRFSASVPNVFVCQATGSVGPIVAAGGSLGTQYYGNAQGTGTCQSLQGSWTVSYSGIWQASVNDSTLSGPGTTGYALSLTLTNVATGQVLQRDQVWDESQSGPLIRVEPNNATVVPDGAGIVNETPTTRAYSDPFTTAANWFFV